ncbi:MAG: hypothetical protein Q9169_000925 [Polycauliona sp. 2 TL-2023]
MASAMATSALYFASRHDLEDIFIAMHPCFKDKESEDNFKLRDQATTKLRRITVGNAPNEYADVYCISIKALLEGIIKVINSLRTTVSKNGCELIQEMAKVEMSNIDNIAEFVLPHLMKLCASTKKIAADKANETTNVLIANISYNIHLMRLIWSACDDKNVQPRKFATGWLKTLIGKHRDHKHVFEKGDGLAIFEKCLKKGLADSNPDVRQAMRPTYWAFIRLWPERSEAILSTLSVAHRKVLIHETAEDGPVLMKVASAPVAKAAASKSKLSLKDAIAAKRQAAKAEQSSAPEPESRRSSSGSIKSDMTTVVHHPKPAVTQPKPAATQSKPAVAQHKPAVTHPKPAVTQPKPAVTEPKPAVAQPKPAVNHPKPAGIQPKAPASASLVSRPAPVTTATRTLSSAPVRPSRVMRKATAPSKPQLVDFSKSVTDAMKSANGADKTLRPGFSKSAIEVSKAATPGSSKSPIHSMSPALAISRDQSQSPPRAAMRPFSPGSTGRVGLSSHRELSPPPLVTALRERSKSRSSSDASASNAAKTPIATSEQLARIAAQTKAAREEQMARDIAQALTGPPRLQLGNVPSSRKEGLARQALEELDINGPIRPCPEHGDAAVQKNWAKIERYQMALSTPEEEHPPTMVFVYGLRQKFLELVYTIKEGSWNLNTFREIQSMIRSSWALLGDDHRLFDELLFTIFNLIDSWNTELYIVRPCGSDHNTQVLLTLRVMLEHHKEQFNVYYPRALCALLSASRKQTDSTHMHFALEDTVKSVIKACDASNREDAIDAVLDYLETYTKRRDRQPEYLGLLALTELMKSSDPERLRRPMGQASRLGRLAAREMGSVYPEVRLRAVEFSMTYASFLADDDEFWRLTSDMSTYRSRLLTYYFTKARVMAAFHVEDQMIANAVSA